MIFYLIAILVLCVYGSDFFAKPSFCNEYLSKRNTASIKGIFVLLVIAQHFVTYVDLHNIYDHGYLLLKGFLGQNIVTVFLFYSGYGIYESIKKKGSSYVKSMPIKRIFITLLHFDIAVFLFVLTNICVGIHFPKKIVLLAFTGWTGIGNSNWYVFAVLFTYIFTWISFRIFSKHHLIAIILTGILSIVYILIVHHARPGETWWYNTVLCYEAGLLYSFFKEKIEHVFLPSQSQTDYYLALLLTFLGVVVFKPFVHHVAIYELWTICFTLMIVLLTMKIAIHNPILDWLGSHIFEIYILQRIPMIILTHFHLNSNPYLFLLITL